MPEVDKIIDFEIPKLSPSIIMVTGVGGGGSNAVNHMFEMEIADVSFMVCNTDPQALRNSPVPVKVRLGQNGLGAGNNPEKGRQAALESLDEIVEIYKREGTKMVFITAGMGAGGRSSLPRPRGTATIGCTAIFRGGRSGPLSCFTWNWTPIPPTPPQATWPRRRNISRFWRGS